MNCSYSFVKWPLVISGIVMERGLAENIGVLNFEFRKMSFFARIKMFNLVYRLLYATRR